MELNQILSRLKKITKTDSDYALAKIIGRKPSSIATWRSRDTIPYELCTQIAMEYDVPIKWIMIGEGTKTEMAVSNKVSLPFYEISASAGPGMLALTEEFPTEISFDPEWLQKNLGASAKDTFIMLAEGDSMEPTIKHDSLIMVDKTKTSNTDGIYVLRYGDALLVKRLQFQFKDNLKIISDNAIYQPLDVKRSELVDNELEIIGRVVWSGQRV
ncbi:LexA family transcriptional regulator [Thalassotalea sp. ND16A]|uniref:LexA family transcriptional regulator n=1 Tax=Thalassotalea sp. ND16A TaxID=1535422 RepID=UPI00051D88CD|nr:LexA family transcriptional regulator [Thalassotalea sp. ND16A]KGJ98134.1 hypothetical protein ND16A_0939 [Thalassotalea sp. ND16A]